MKNVTDNFKLDLRTYGRQIDVKIQLDDVEANIDNFNSVKPSFNADLFKTIMHQVEIDSKVSMTENTKINIQVGIKLNEKKYEYINLNTYYVKTCERKEDTNSYRILAYTKMKEAMIDYDLELAENITLRNYLIKIFQRLSWDTSNIPATFINSDKLINPALHTGIGYTFRDALDEIATISCSFILFDGEVPTLLYLTNTNETIDESYLNEDNITIGEKYFINSLVFSRAEESDNIYRKDDVSIATNGLKEYRISDNQLLSTNDRSEYIDEMFNYLKTLEFYVFDIQSKGILFLEACDMFNLNLNEVTYPVVLLNNEINIEDGLSESLYFDEPEETETDYKYADSTDKKINQTYILVDKQNQIIERVVSNVTDQNEKISQVTQTVEELNSKIGDIADITVSKESSTGTVSFEGINQSEPIRVEIHPIGTNISYLYPRDNLYPSDDLFMTDRVLRFTNTETNEIFDYELPDNLLYYDAENYDEFILDYDGLSCVINKKVGYNADGTTYILEMPRTVSYDFPKIELTDGDYTVELLGYSNAYLFVRLMAQNIYTTQFATKAEVNSEISQKADAINFSVDKKLSNYSTTEEMNSAISVKANEITSSVSNNYATKTQLTNEVSTLNSTITQKADSITSEVSKKVGNDEIISKINQSAEAVGIDAKKIELSAEDILNLIAGNTINLTSKNITISSNAFQIDKNGYVKVKGNSSNSDLFRVETLDGNTFAYIQPIGAGFVDKNGDGRVYISAGDISSIDLYGTSGLTEIRNTGITTPVLTQTSLESQKKNFEKMQDNALNIINDIDIYKYNLKSEEDTDKKHIGFVIGDNYKYSKEVTSNDNTGVDIYSFVSLCCKAIQEQQTQIEMLRNEIKEMEANNE